jgi:hypothetical protein
LNISAGLERDRDINTRDHFQVHFKCWQVMAHQNPGEMSVAPSVELLCVPRAPAGVPSYSTVLRYLSILRRTIEFNEAEIENTTEHMRDIQRCKVD